MQLSCQRRNRPALRCQPPLRPAIFLPCHWHSGSRCAQTVTLVRALDESLLSQPLNVLRNLPINAPPNPNVNCNTSPSVRHSRRVLLVRASHVRRSPAVHRACRAIGCSRAGACLPRQRHPPPRIMPRPPPTSSLSPPDASHMRPTRPFLLPRLQLRRCPDSASAPEIKEVWGFVRCLNGVCCRCGCCSTA